ncbi:phosphatase PAP2 family protein [Sphingomonas nostoxanthinifaciens]|uniref:phosphatase PAP2 family protein n=1 Tax=Sphingomonas nostoxanthinifaciens TaxID=2872652 RepID=UPI001CC21ADD|nr:phosphatase PAP2 family protein [Sphingomonas nostoxanthinifaciens]UAK25717.1 phosphatase PAP2 family protein [Sphingomonas nostoxanthinifaciens]
MLLADHCGAMAKHSKPERADVKVAQKLAPARKSPVVRALGTLSELADQPQLNTICVATLGVGLITGNRRMAKAGFRMLVTQLLSTRLKGLIKHSVDRTRPKAVAEGRNYERHAGSDGASEMNSFPSGHTAGAVAVARAFVREYPEHSLAAYAGAAAVGLIQVPRSKHYPSDVAAGMVVGLLADGLVSGAVTRWTSARNSSGSGSNVASRKVHQSALA